MDWWSWLIVIIVYVQVWRVTFRYMLPFYGDSPSWGDFGEAAVHSALLFWLFWVRRLQGKLVPADVARRIAGETKATRQKRIERVEREVGIGK